MQTKYKVPEDVRQSVLGYVTGYKRMKAWYKTQRGNILYNSSVKVDADGVRVWMSFNSGPGDPTAQQAIKLAALEEHHNVLVIKAVEEARDEVSQDIENPAELNRFRKALMESCRRGTKGYGRFSFDVSGLHMSKPMFYRRRLKFIYLIAEKMKMV